MGATSSHLIGPAYEAGLDRARRRRDGVFYTPPEVATGLVRLALAHREDPTSGSSDDSPRPARSMVRRTGAVEPVGTGTGPTVCDLSAGGGAFLLAAAAELELAGHGRGHIVEELLWGVDADADAVAVCREALATWAAEGDGVEGRVLARHVVVGDGLAGLDAWPDAPSAGFDVVVGNPPYQNQLARATARSLEELAGLRTRFGAAASPYVDTAALFLVAATGAAAPGASVVLVLPESVLSTRDAAGARATVLESCGVRGLWWAGSHLFDAVVDVCAPVLGKGAAHRIPVPRWTGAGMDTASPVALPADELAGGAPWGVLLAPSAGPDRVVLPARRVLGDVCHTTAGFRDQFYGLDGHVREADADPAVDRSGRPRLITSGLVDPLRCGWGKRPARFAGHDWTAPCVDLDGLAAEDAPLARWGSDRLVPKVVLATQTKVLEAAVDVEGTWWPSVPTIAVVPLEPDRPGVLWELVAVLLAPAVSAWALDRHRGAALGRDAVKLSASQVREIPLPTEVADWTRGAAAAERAQRAADAEDPRGWRDALVELGAAMTEAYGSSSDVREWWLARLPRWRGPASDTVST